MDQRRHHYIDWLRVSAVLLLFPFHAGRVFNAWEPFYAKSTVESAALSFMIGFIDGWHMPLLFLLAGASTYFAMRRRSLGHYASERARRLLIPLFFGILILVPPQTWYGARTNDGYTGSFGDYLTGGRFLSLDNLFGRGDYFGGMSPAHLWFIMFLWVLSMMLLPLLAFDRSERGAAALTRWAGRIGRPAWWPAVLAVVFLAEAMPDIGGKNPFYYFAFFTLGYVMMHDGAFLKSAERLWMPMLIGGSVLAGVRVALDSWAETLPDPSLGRVFWTYAGLAGSWMILVGLVGLCRRSLDRPSTTLSYLSEASYPIYILHQTVIVIVGFYLVTVVSAPLPGWLLLMGTSAALTFALYEVVRRYAPLRFLFGMRPLPRQG